jgi:hypothetical protein
MPRSYHASTTKIAKMRVWRRRLRSLAPSVDCPPSGPDAVVFVIAPGLSPSKSPIGGLMRAHAIRDAAVWQEDKLSRHFNSPPILRRRKVAPAMRQFTLLRAASNSANCCPFTHQIRFAELDNDNIERARLLLGNSSNFDEQSFLRLWRTQTS